MDLHLPPIVKFLLITLFLLSCLGIVGYYQDNAILLLIGLVSFILLLYAVIRVVMVLYGNIKKLQDQGYEIDKHLFKKDEKGNSLLKQYLKNIAKNATPKQPEDPS